jgi:uncharacterized protein
MLRACGGACLFFATFSLFAFDVPPLTDPVMDMAGMISPEVKGQIDTALRYLRNQGGTQIAVLTIPSLDGAVLEEASIKVADKWKLGSAAKDDGVLLLIAKAERKIRIEVGQGREGDLPDAYARRIIDDKMTPMFRAGKVSEGVANAVLEIARRTDPKVDLQAFLSVGGPSEDYAQDLGSHPSNRKSDISLIFFMIFFMFVSLVYSVLGGNRRGHSGWGGGGFGGGGGGGGGFSGGGGGFSGGGASGGW